ncbi:isoprenylcysteine carboxylmethyltransferase family protein [Streptomyces sp. NPDC049099]|uniref:methyltransferase family protein n=1 Tax=Streptomyces sp. NPDC049099 TaxID=3155768 RepID=UPI0034282F73
MGGGDRLGTRSSLEAWVLFTLPRRLLPAAGVSAFFILVGRFEGFWRHLQYWRPEPARLGVLLAVASTALLLWSRWVLGTMWASVPTVREHHELRTDGPYRLVRHPIYTGLLGLVTGSVPACGFGVRVAFLVAAIPGLLRRVRVEDRLMARRFGAAYDAYRAEVPALIPHIRRTAHRVGRRLAGSVPRQGPRRRDDPNDTPWPGRRSGRRRRAGAVTVHAALPPVMA